MKNIKKLVALTSIMALCAGQVQGQECDTTVCDDSAAYCDCDPGSYWSAAIPIGAIAIAAIIIATTSHHHHHHHSSSGGDPSSSSSSSSISSHCY